MGYALRLMLDAHATSYQFRELVAGLWTLAVTWTVNTSASGHVGFVLEEPPQTDRVQLTNKVFGAAAQWVLLLF